METKIKATVAKEIHKKIMLTLRTHSKCHKLLIISFVYYLLIVNEFNKKKWITVSFKLKMFVRCTGLPSRNGSFPAKDWTRSHNWLGGTRSCEEYYTSTGMSS